MKVIKLFLYLIFLSSFSIFSMQQYRFDDLITALSKYSSNLSEPVKQIFDAIYRADLPWFKSVFPLLIKENNIKIYNVSFIYQEERITAYDFTLLLAIDLANNPNQRYYNLIEIAKILVDHDADLYVDDFAEELLNKNPVVKNAVEGQTKKRRRESQADRPAKLRIDNSGQPINIY